MTNMARWTEATGKLPYGVQHVFHDVLTLVAEGKKKDLVYGVDYLSKGACLVNSAANMLVSSGGHGIPMANFEDVVTMFDRINQELRIKNVNESDNIVSPLAAEILLRNFAPLKDFPDAVVENVVSDAYIEATDEEMQEAFMSMLANRPVYTPFDVVEPIRESAKQE